jgi:hypothetical protein
MESCRDIFSPVLLFLQHVLLLLQRLELFPKSSSPRTLSRPNLQKTKASNGLNRFHHKLHNHGFLFTNPNLERTCTSCNCVERRRRRRRNMYY